MTAVPHRQGTGWTTGLAWSLALVAVAFTLATVDYRSRDQDSTLYSGIAARLATQPVTRWIAPEWWGGWGKEGLFKDHPAGIFVPPALLAALGYPAPQAAFALNALYQVVSLVLIQRLAGVFASPLESRSLGWMLQLLPIAFTYRIRANQEQAVLVCLLAALYATARSRANPLWGGLTTLAMLWMMLIKGLFAVLVPLSCAWLLVAARRSDGAARRPQGGAWLGLALALATSLVAAIAYEGLYRHVTGESFLSHYLAVQWGAAAAPRGAWIIPQKIYNVFWYAARLAWFAFPLSVAAVVAVWSERGTLVRWLRRPGGAAPDQGDAGTRDGLVFALGLSAFHVALFSLSDRKADRYIFPAYYLVGGCGAVAAIRYWPRLRRFVEQVDRRHPWGEVGVWVGTFGLNLIGGWLQLPRIKVWRPE